ncbi:glycoside hydrolase family 32 protein [Photobacterium rosenbergii]|uniref:glycoside hydrolase family 32 protein n=1 Tax=Photobacterium rosenbergii TaxID=294936 RepID=UPI0021BD5AAF|nr:glycoside hydrolase family 32 protein [Photobacterium rosenbergii]
MRWIDTEEEQDMAEAYRPKLHMTPDQGWMNDPNGLVYFNGHYHQFYQYYPHDTVWGPMHWGHKVSQDLINWQELPPALYPDESGMCFSGSAIVDWNNISGLFENGKPGLLAFYTSFIQPEVTLADGRKVEDPIQQQSLAYSQDGMTWKKYQDGEPIIPARGNPDFRDPKVIWHPASQAWVMVVSCGQHIEFYRSSNLLDWQLVSEFGYRHGAHSKGPWECPDLFELQIEGSDETRWVLVVGIGEGAHCGGAGTQYFIGDFDGKTFTNHNHPEEILWLDFGRDYYATQSFSDLPSEDGRRIVSTWMSNHQYSLELPTQAFRSSMAMPRELFLFESKAGLRVGQRFVRELDSVLGYETKIEGELSVFEGISKEGKSSVMKCEFAAALSQGQTLSLSLFEDSDIEFQFKHIEAGLEIRSLRKGQFGHARIDEHYPHDYSVVLPVGPEFSLSALVDNGSVELLINGGEFSFTNLAFARNTEAMYAISVDNGELPILKSSIKMLVQGEQAC